LTNSFSRKVLHWFDSHGRHDLPWQENSTPYRVWVSEIMLQQTQVATVIPYYKRFTKKFPTVKSLATAESDQVLHLWTGLGYYARARNLHKTAQIIQSVFEGSFPNSVADLIELPGIGRSTAGAIVALSMNVPATILDGNVKRVLTRNFAISGWPEQGKIKQQLWDIAENLTPKKRVKDYTQAIMDLGATVCTRSKPSCFSCPLNKNCIAFNDNSISKFPGKKPRKTLPVKSLVMFVLQSPTGEILLEKRPPSGIWGSLYSLPESKSAEELPQLNHISFKRSENWALPPLRHTFSHYHLDIQPVLFKATQKMNSIADSDRWLWYPLDHSVEVGLAAPVKKLLSSLT
jgi:A/G-specific adenine glycosylase